MLIVFILLLIGLYVVIDVHDRMHPNDVPKIDNYWEVEERLRQYKANYFLSSPIDTTRFR